MAKHYDQRYFDRWYRGRQARDPRMMQRKVVLALAMAEHYLGRPVRSVLDVGCGEAPWRALLLKSRPKLHYQGVDSSEYAVARHGRRCNIALAGFGQLDQLRFGAPVDLLVCSDVLHYVPTAELKRGLSGFAELCGGLAYLDLYTAEDEIEGDLRGFIPRRASSYRRWIAAAGFVECGSGGWLGPGLREQASALELPA